MDLSTVHQGVVRRKKKKRVARGTGSGKGKTATRGHKGQYASAGAKRPIAAFEGGQMPLFRRIPKRGFSHARWDKTYLVVNIGDLDKAFKNGSTVDREALKAAGLAKGPADGVRILGTGELSKKLTVKAHHFSKSALEKIIAKGGTAELIPPSRKPQRNKMRLPGQRRQSETSAVVKTGETDAAGRNPQSIVVLKGNTLFPSPNSLSEDAIWPFYSALAGGGTMPRTSFDALVSQAVPVLRISLEVDPPEQDDLVTFELLGPRNLCVNAGATTLAKLALPVSWSAVRAQPHSRCLIPDDILQKLRDGLSVQPTSAPVWLRLNSRLPTFPMIGWEEHLAANLGRPFFRMPHLAVPPDVPPKPRIVVLFLGEIGELSPDVSERLSRGLKRLPGRAEVHVFPGTATPKLIAAIENMRGVRVHGPLSKAPETAAAEVSWVHGVTQALGDRAVHEVRFFCHGELSLDQAVMLLSGRHRASVVTAAELAAQLDRLQATTVGLVNCGIGSSLPALRLFADGLSKWRLGNVVVADVQDTLSSPVDWLVLRGKSTRQPVMAYRHPFAAYPWDWLECPRWGSFLDSTTFAEKRELFWPCLIRDLSNPVLGAHAWVRVLRTAALRAYARMLASPHTDEQDMRGIEDAFNTVREAIQKTSLLGELQHDRGAGQSALAVVLESLKQAASSFPRAAGK